MSGFFNTPCRMGVWRRVILYPLLSFWYILNYKHVRNRRRRIIEPEFMPQHHRCALLLLVLKQTSSAWAAFSLYLHIIILASLFSSSLLAWITTIKLTPRVRSGDALYVPRMCESWVRFIVGLINTIYVHRIFPKILALPNLSVPARSPDQPCWSPTFDT